MAEPLPSPTPPNRSRQLALWLVVAIGAVAIVLPLVPKTYRPFNVAAFGAIGLFVASRVGLLPGMGLMLGFKLVSDLLLLNQQGNNPDYLPFPTVYAAFLLYPLLGWLLLRRTESPLRIGGVALTGSLTFFVVTNFISWLQQVDPYGYTPAGLVHCFVAAIPFYWGTLLGDLCFAGLLFGAHAVLVQASEPAEAREEVRV